MRMRKLYEGGCGAMAHPRWVRPCGARVLTSAKCAAILEEREQKKKKGIEEKNKWKAERDQKKREKEEAAKKKAEEQAKKAKEVAKKRETRSKKRSMLAHHNQAKKQNCLGFKNLFWCR